MGAIMSNTLAARWAPQTTKNARTSGAVAPPPLPMRWLQRLYWRAELKALDAAQLRDCGLDPATVANEAMKPFWRD
jgi:uncharacterized protein YjiS (DUF1127 family)